MVYCHKSAYIEHLITLKLWSIRRELSRWLSDTNEPRVIGQGLASASVNWETCRDNMKNVCSPCHSNSYVTKWTCAGTTSDFGKKSGTGVS